MSDRRGDRQQRGDYQRGPGGGGGGGGHGGRDYRRDYNDRGGGPHQQQHDGRQHGYQRSFVGQKRGREQEVPHDPKKALLARLMALCDPAAPVSDAAACCVDHAVLGLCLLGRPERGRRARSPTLLIGRSRAAAGARTARSR